MIWKTFPKWLKIESVVIGIISTTLLLFTFILLSKTGDDSYIGVAIFREIILPIVVSLVATWMLSYSIFKKSYRSFFYFTGVLVVIWITLVLLLQN